MPLSIDEIKDRIRKKPHSVEIAYSAQRRCLVMYDFNDAENVIGGVAVARFPVPKDKLIELMLEHGDIPEQW